MILGYLIFALLFPLVIFIKSPLVGILFLLALILTFGVVRFAKKDFDYINNRNELITFRVLSPSFIFFAVIVIYGIWNDKFSLLGECMGDCFEYIALYPGLYLYSIIFIICNVASLFAILVQKRRLKNIPEAIKYQHTLSFSIVMIVLIVSVLIVLLYFTTPGWVRPDPNLQTVAELSCENNSIKITELYKNPKRTGNPYHSTSLLYNDKEVDTVFTTYWSQNKNVPQEWSQEMKDELNFLVFDEEIPPQHSRKNLWDIYINPDDFSMSDFEIISSCLTNNLDTIEKGYSDLKNSRYKFRVFTLNSVIYSTHEEVQRSLDLNNDK